MTDAVFLDEVMGFLHNLDEPLLPGSELIQSLDKSETLLCLPGTEVALQLLDVTAIDGLFSPSEEKDHHSATDSDCTSVECESVASTSSPRPPVVEDVRSRDAIRRSTYRKKQKEQKNALYTQVEELTAQLAKLRQSKEDAKNRQSVGLTQTAVWKALANRHLQARLSAEEQRRRLHEAVHRRATLIQDLGMLVRKRIGEEQPEARHPVKKPRTESPDVVLYKTYLKELDEVYAKTDKVFQETMVEYSEEEAEGYYNPPRKVSKHSTYHELVGRTTTPFAFDRVRPRIEGLCIMENRPGSERIEAPWIPEHTAIVKHPILAPDGSKSLVVHSIMRRYFEADRIVVVWRKFTEGEGAFAGMHLDETGWNSIRPSPAQGCPGTVLESIIRFVPINFSGAASSGAVVKQFADTIIKAGEEDCLKCMQKLEEMLLNEALGVC